MYNNILIDINNKTHNEHNTNKFNDYFVTLVENITKTHAGRYHLE